jgi:hypothetical protein
MVIWKSRCVKKGREAGKRVVWRSEVPSAGWGYNQSNLSVVWQMLFTQIVETQIVEKISATES